MRADDLHGARWPQPGLSALHGLRVLMLTPSYHPRRGGVEKHVACVVRELRRQGLQVMVATPRWQPEWPEEEVVADIPVLRLSGNVAWRALRHHARWADLVHTHDAYPFLKYYLPYRLLHPRTPAVVTFHGYERFPIPLEARALRRMVLWLTRGSICAGAFIPKWYRFRSDYITHGGVDAPAQVPPPGQGAVFVGRLEPDTGFIHYLEALRALKQEHGVEMPVQVCGDGSLRHAGEQLAAAAGLNATFHGVVPDVTPYLAGARFALVSGFLAILEAMAAARVVLALYQNPLKEDYLRMFPGAQYMVIAGSVEELADRLSLLARDPAAAGQMAQESRKFALTQTWERVADLYLELYRKVLAHGGGR